MAKKGKKRTYHSTPVQKNSYQRPIRLSQCMIVKNEEKNIVQALSWAKGIAFEQIVVDTGSTDKTVEIAESMGAKVYHFEWINDFSAAKNFAIDQAKGNWIAFLDADEYLDKNNAGRLIGVLQSIEANQQLRINDAIVCPLVNLDDQGRPFMVFNQRRFFRNKPDIRYVGSIHESLAMSTSSLSVPVISITHTGYSKRAFEDTKKVVRNIEMIRAELDKNPDDPNLKCYLADALAASGEEDNTKQAEALYKELVDTEQSMLFRDLKQGAYNFLCAAYFANEDMISESFNICKRAYEEYPDNPDFCYYYGRKLQDVGDYTDAWAKFIECEKLLKRESVDTRASYILKNPMLLFFHMVLVSEKLENVAEVIRCATLVLREDKYQHLMLIPYIEAFNRSGYTATAAEVFEILNKLYDFTNTRDKLTTMQAAKKAGNTALVQLILSTFTKEELEWLTGTINGS